MSQTRAEQDDTCGQFEPSQVTTSRAFKPAEHPLKLCQEVRAALHRIANLPDPRLRLQPKPCPACPLLSRAIAVRPIGLHAREVAWVETRDRRLRHRRMDRQGLQHVLGLTAIVRVGSGHHDPNGMARASQAKCNAVPHLPRSTGLGPVCSPLFLLASWSRPARPHPS